MANSLLITLSILLVLASQYRTQGSSHSSQLKNGLFSLRSESDEAIEALSVSISSQEGLKEKDRIEKLSGQPDQITFNQYAGHITVDFVAGRALYYYFVESPDNCISKPLVLWLTGEPGCSALGLGAMIEIGPFKVNKDGKTLYRNPYAWTDEANAIFLETPIGVGFSYSNTSSDYKLVGDDFTVQDTYTIVNWFERFPEYKHRDFFLAGITNAAPIMIKRAHQLTLYPNQPAINVKGIALGNRHLSWESWWKGIWDYSWTHALISDEMYWAYKLHCKRSHGKFITPHKCDDIFYKMWNITYHVNFLDLNRPTCNYTWGTHDWEKKMESLLWVSKQHKKDCVKIASLELTDYTLNWWDYFTKERIKNQQRPISSLQEMKKILRERYVPSSYSLAMRTSLNHMVQGSKSVRGYWGKLEDLKFRSGTEEDKEITMSRFIQGLNPKIVKVVELHDYNDVDELVHKTTMV